MHLWLSPGPLCCWKTSWCPALWTKLCKSSTQHALESPSPSLAGSQWGGGRMWLKMLLLSCWKTRYRRGGNPLRHHSSIWSVTPHMPREGRGQKSLWCLKLELEVREWQMIREERNVGGEWMFSSSIKRLSFQAGCICYSLTTLSLMMLLTPVLPPAVALQWYDPSDVSTTFSENVTNFFPSILVNVSIRTSPSLISS